MAALVYRSLRRIAGGILHQNNIQRQCFYCTTTAESHAEVTDVASIQESAPTQEKDHTFEELLEGSQLMKIRRPQGRAVSGLITNVCNDDIYVDFGGKFEVVVKKPAMNPEQYQVGKHVRIMLKKLEMTGHFLGQHKHITLLEADGWLMGLAHKKSLKS